MSGRKKGVCWRSEVEVGGRCMHEEMHSFIDYQCSDNQNFLLLTLGMWDNFFSFCNFQKRIQFNLKPLISRMPK